MSFPLAWVLFPGIVFHEFSHAVACFLCGVKIKEIKFDLSEAFVLHDAAKPVPSVIISVAPFLLGNLVGFQLLASANILISKFHPLLFLYYWFGLSLVYHSFPSSEDAKNSFTSFIDFYKEKLFSDSAILNKLFFVLLFPIAFLPLIVLLALILFFAHIFALRFIWLLAVVVFSWGY